MHRHHRLTRRRALIAPAALALGACSTKTGTTPRNSALTKADTRDFRELEQRYDARLGVWATTSPLPGRRDASRSSWRSSPPGLIPTTNTTTPSSPKQRASSRPV